MVETQEFKFLLWDIIYYDVIVYFSYVKHYICQVFQAVL